MGNPMRHYVLYCETFIGPHTDGTGGAPHQICDTKGIIHEGDYQYEAQAIKDMTERAQTLLAHGNYGSVWMHIYCVEKNRNRDVKKWTLTKGQKPRKVNAHNAIIYDVDKPKTD